MSAVDYGILIHLIGVEVCKYRLSKTEIGGRDHRKHQKKWKERHDMIKKEMLEER